MLFEAQHQVIGIVLALYYMEVQMMVTQVDTESLALKLHPNRFPGMSDKMAAIVGFFMGKEYTTPAIERLCVTMDGCCLAQQAGDVGFSIFLGQYSEVERNWRDLVTIPEVGLTEQEEVYCLKLLQTAVQYA